MDLPNSQLPTRPSSTPVSAMGALDLNLQKENIQPLQNTNPPSSQPNLTLPSTLAYSHPTLPPIYHDYLDPTDGNHSSEEELEEINNKCSPPHPVSTPPTTSSTSDSGDESMPPPSVPTSTPSQPPLQFSTSPPTHVHKPRRSSSPPAKMFLMDRNGIDELRKCSPPRFASFGGVTRSASLGGDIGGCGPLDVDDGPSRVRRRPMISPRKRYRQARQGAHGQQRPCLDFEKMQQLKTRAVTSWRHGGELSLFCW